MSVTLLDKRLKTDESYVENETPDAAIPINPNSSNQSNFWVIIPLLYTNMNLFNIESAPLMLELHVFDRNIQSLNKVNELRTAINLQSVSFHSNQITCIGN